MPFRYPANRGKRGLVTVIGRAGGRVLETDAALAVRGGAKTIQEGI